MELLRVHLADERHHFQRHSLSGVLRCTSEPGVMYDGFETLLVSSPGPCVLHVQMNRPSKRNAMNAKFWTEFRECFERIAQDSDARAVIVSGVGDHFSAGLDLADNSNLTDIAKTSNDVARRAFRFRKLALAMQESFSAIERCPQPVIAAIHGVCIGAAVDLVCACDIRLCSEDASFCIAEVKVGLAADVGTLQRMPKIVGNESLCRELAFTGRLFGAAEALRMGFVSRTCGPGSRRTEAIEASLATAAEIARQSPVAVFGTKRNIIYGRDHSVEDGLEYAATWSGAALQAEDLGRAMRAGLSRNKKGAVASHPTFSKL